MLIILSSDINKIETFFVNLKAYPKTGSKRTKRIITIEKRKMTTNKKAQRYKRVQ